MVAAAMPSLGHECPFCPLAVSSAEKLRIHIQQECKERPDWDLFCSFCGLEYESKKQLNVHMSRWCKERK